jgi:transposase
MSLNPCPIDLVPPETARVARAAFPKGNRYMTMRDELGVLYANDLFADLYPQVGHYGEPPWRLALVTLMQFSENLTDRQAADAVRGRIDWKYALGLALTDPGFDFSVLSEFRTRLIAGAAEERLLTTMLDRFTDRGLLKSRGHQRTDSTHIVAAVRSLNRLEIVGETLHAALNALAQVAPAWLRAHVTAEWFLRYGNSFSDYQQPQGPGERQQLAETIGRDGRHLLTAMYRDTAPASLRMVTAVETLRQVWVQQFYMEADEVQWRDIKDWPPSSVMIASPYDLDSRYSEKRGQYWRGYKGHVTETCDDDTPHVITHVETTMATDQDVTAVDAIHHALEQHNRLPGVHVVDGAYTSGEKLASSQSEYQIDLLGPMRQDQSWQAHDPQAFDLSHFQIDWDQEIVLCPMGKHSRPWKPSKGPRGKPTLQVAFYRKDCAACHVRERCTRSTTEARGLTLHPKAQHLALQAARERQQTARFKEDYKRRAGIEGTLSQASFAFGMRRTRYRGLPKTPFHHLATAMAINLQRFVDWVWEIPRSKTRQSHFARLELAT